MNKIKAILHFKDGNEIYYEVGKRDVTKIEWVNVKSTLYLIYKNDKLHSELHEVTEVFYDK